MAQFKVDDFLIELNFCSQKVLKGLEKAEKQTMQIASRIEKRLNKAFRVNPTPLNDSLKVMERNVDKTVSKIEQRLKNTRAFKIKTEIDDTLKPLRQPRQPRISGNRAITAAYSANMSKLKGFDPILQKYIKSQFYGLSAKAGQMDNTKFNEALAKLNSSVREAIAKARGHTSTSINGDRAANSLDSLSSAAVKTAGAFISFQAVLSAYQRVMEVGLQRASSERSIDFVFGDQSTQVKKFIQDLTQITGMDTTETQAQFASFGASATTTMGLEGSEELFKNLTGFARLMGRSDEQIQRALTAVSQMASKGQVMAEELKGQLSEALPGATQAFAKALGLTEKQLFDKMKNGDVKASDALPKFAKELGSQIDSRGGWKAIQDSTQTMLGNLKNTWNNSLTDIFKGSEDGLQDFTRSLTTLLNSLGGSGKTLGESLGNLMTSMSHGVDNLTDISYRVRAFFDEVTLAYRSLNDTQKKIVDGLSDGLIDGLKMLAVAVTAQKAANVAGGLLNLANAVTSFGDAVNKAKAGKAGSSGGALSKVGRVVLYAELVNFALDNLNPEAAKNPNLHQSGIGTETNFNPEYKGDSTPNQINDGWAKIGSSIADWFNGAANKIANFQEPMSNLVNNTQSTPPAITGDMVNSNAQLAMAVSELGRKVDALTLEAKKPLSVNIKGEAIVRPDEPAFFIFNQSANDQFTQDMLLSSSYPEEE
ncbi:tape measure protein [Salmonella enterica subsp. enterica serovar Typhi]|uniref:Tape measure protein n=4 Tax=Enterobacteriaceae TaxID=543 RepID=A0A739JUM9_SALTI|nr:tape measure protein [Salmonella enterica subsp. enterica serovar Typhi]HAD5799069.1 phage tail tape measure protein [Salmonella enterica subsp. enterica serovar Typhi str. CT18]EDJ8007793.1 phage tail tape measure protein [Salmonella enterica subsp. enterica serovar Typhi]EDW9468524.1 tape measure protein [Salmonella enterica subsp. enterica serovar Typhi]EHG1151519.1 tape measure protein [Salmonella enterica subsp. enterica serovar Typhi]